jgi:hypothetical protein
MGRRCPCSEALERELCGRLKKEREEASSQQSVVLPTDPRERAEVEFGLVYAEVVGRPSVTSSRS